MMMKFIDSFGEISMTTISGSMDIVVLKTETCKLKSSPFYVCFSLASVLKPRGKVVNILIDGEERALRMRLNQLGRGYFPKTEMKTEYSDSCSQFSEDEEMPQPKRKKQAKKEFSVEWASKTNRSHYNMLTEKDSKESRSMLQYVFGLFRSEKPFQPRLYSAAVQRKYSNESSRIHQHYYEGEQQFYDPVIIMSQCGHLIKPSMTDHQLKTIFYANRVQQPAFTDDPMSYINNSNLMVLINSTVYTWEIGLAVMISELAFGRVRAPMVDKLTEAKKGLFWSKKGGLKIDFKIDDPEQFRAIAKQEQDRPRSIDSRHSVSSKTSSGRQRKFILNPTHDQLRSLQLKPGANKITFQLQGKQYISLSSNIYFLDHTQKLIISDIDGTITREDVLGQLYPIIGKSFLHPGIMPFYHELANRGYQLIYLTARSLGQTRTTKEQLQQALDGQGIGLPKGPLFTSYEGLYDAFTKEVVHQTPEVIKIEVLNSIRKMYGENPFSAGFGNRSSDFLAYKSMGIPQDRIFIININSQIIRMDAQTVITNYEKLKEQADQLFPKM